MEEKYRVLVEKLNSNTLEKKITWETTSLDNQYKVKLGLGSIVLSKVARRVSRNKIIYLRTYYELEIINDEGSVSNSISLYEKENKDFLLLKELYINIENTYLKRDETIDSMLDELDKL